MTISLPTIELDSFVNPARTRSEPYGEARKNILGGEALATARGEISTWPGYAPTRLVNLPTLAAAMSVRSVHYKDEGARFGLGSFKALGGAYAVGRLLCRVLGKQLGRPLSTTDLLRDASVRTAAAGITVTCATDGNHGRSVAWGAQMFGCRCVIYVHATVSQGRQAAIEHFAATVVRTAGNYDEAVQQADRDAHAQGWYVISDTSYPGYMDVPRDVMQGYQVMVEEAVGQLGHWPTHVFVQAGVGGFAAAVCAWFWERDPARRPFFTVVEPENAACLMASARAGALRTVTGGLNTLMAGLACGEVSRLAWDVLAHGADAFCTIPDTAAVATMRLLAHPAAGEPAIVAGESAVAGLAAAIAAVGNPAIRAAFQIGDDSELLFFGSEADTDPALYRELVGESSREVLSGQNV